MRLLEEERTFNLGGSAMLLVGSTLVAGGSLLCLLVFGWLGREAPPRRGDSLLFAFVPENQRRNIA